MMSTLSSSVGAMFTAASVTISVSAYVGTSITKQWLTRRAVRSPVSRCTTAPISSSVCRLPFISASALPSRTSSTAFAAEPGCMARRRLAGRDVDAVFLGHGLDARLRADQDRRDQSESRRVDRAVQRTLVARMRDGGRGRRQRLAEIQQPLVLSCVCSEAGLVWTIDISPCGFTDDSRLGKSL